MASSGKKKIKGLKDPYAQVRCSNSIMCSSYLHAPVFTCSSGAHKICSTCVSFCALKCPVCGGVLKFTPLHIDLMNLIDSLLISCPYVDQGCQYKFPSNEMRTHESECIYGVKNCFSIKCGWSGNMDDLVRHMEDCHKERVYREPEVTFHTRKVNSRKGSVHHMSFITCEYGNFWIKYQFIESEEQFYGAVMYLGPTQEAEKLECVFEMQELEEDGEPSGLKCVYSGKIYTLNDTFDDIFETYKCFSVCLDFAKYFEHEDVLKVVVIIRKAL